MRNEQWQVIGRGFNGWHAEAVSKSGGRISGSGGLLDVDWYGRRAERCYLDEAAEGALVYDASKADADAFMAEVFRGPMLDLSLEPNGFRALFDAERSPGEPGPLDYIGVGRFEQRLRRVPGVHFGRVVAGAVVWEGDHKPT